MTAVVTDSDTEAVVREFIRAVWNGEDIDAIERMTTPDFALHQLVADEHHDRDGFRTFQTRLLAAVPDFSMAIEDLVVQDAAAVALVTMGGTPEKPLRAIQPTGESFEVHAFQQYRLEDGLLAEVWVLADAMGTLSQLGLFPPPPSLLLRMVANAVRQRLLGG